MTSEEFVRQAYARADVKDIAAWVGCFSPDGVFVDESVGVTYCGPSEVGEPVENFGAAFRYRSGTVILGQLGVVGNLDAVRQQHASV